MCLTASGKVATRREKSRLKKVSYLVSQNKICTLHVVVLMCFLQVFRSSNYAYIESINCHALGVYNCSFDLVWAQLNNLF